MIDLPPYVPPEEPQGPAYSYRTFYDPVDGRGIYSTSQAIEPYPDWVEGRYDMRKYYFPDGVPTLKEEMTPAITGNDPVVLGEVISFTGFPDDATLTIDRTVHKLDDGAINITLTTPGSYTVSAMHMRFLPWGATLDAS